MRSHQQQSRLRPQRARRRHLRADEGRLQLSGDDARSHGRLVRPRAGLVAMGQASRAVGRLYRHRRRARQRLPQIRRPRTCAASTATSATRPRQSEFHITAGGAPATVFGASGDVSDRTACNQGWSDVYTTPQTSSQPSRLSSTRNADVALTPAWSLQANALHPLVLPIDSGRQPHRRAGVRSPHKAARRASSVSMIAVTPANGLNGQQLANNVPRLTRRSARTTARTRNPPPSARALQATDAEKLFGHVNRCGDLAPASTTASRISAPARSWERDQP